MPTIAPISELRNYGQVLDKVEAGKPVYLTKNGRGEYSIHSLEDDEIFDKARAMVKLVSQLTAGFASGEEEGWISDDEVAEHFKNRRRRLEG
jgi:prevent-host-death family protein